jgi:hypothetical protein
MLRICDSLEVRGRRWLRTRPPVNHRIQQRIDALPASHSSSGVCGHEEIQHSAAIDPRLNEVIERLSAGSGRACFLLDRDYRLVWVSPELRGWPDPGRLVQVE